MMTRAAAAMVKLEMQSDELARFLVATIGTSTHSPDAIAKSFELRDPVGPVPLRTENVRSHIEIAVGAGGAAAAHGSCHGERPEMQARELADLRISNAGGSWLTPPLCFQEASAGGDREAAHDGPGDAIACAATGPASTSGEPGCSLSQRCDRPESQRFACLGAQVGSFCCRPIIEGIQEQHKRGRPTPTPPVPLARLAASAGFVETSRVWLAADPMWRISEHHSVQLQRLQKKYPACIDLPYILRDLRMLGQLSK